MLLCSTTAPVPVESILSSGQDISSVSQLRLAHVSIFKIDSARKLKKQKIGSLTLDEVKIFSKKICKIQEIEDVIVKEKYPGIFEFVKKKLD